MGVKVIDKIPVEFHSSKFDLLAIDLLEIIHNDIECCELTDFPYSDKTGMASINADSKRVFTREFRKLTGKNISRDDVPFFIKRAKEKDGTCKYYAYFATNTWHKMIDNARKSTKV